MKQLIRQQILKHNSNTFIVKVRGFITAMNTADLTECSSRSFPPNR